MDALKAVGLCALLAAPPLDTEPCGSVIQVSNPAIDRWQPLIEAASKRFGVPVTWIRAVMARESAGLTTLHGAPMVSSAGAMGLMQLMPGTWSDMRAKFGLGPDPFDPHDNIFAGAAYLRQMFDHYGCPDLFAAYQAGPRRLDAVLAGLKPLPETTRTYLESIVRGAEIASVVSEKRPSLAPKTDSNSLFFVRAGDEKLTSNGTAHSRAAQGLFVPLVSGPDSGTH